MEGFLAVFNSGNFLAYLGVAISVLLSGTGSAKGMSIVGQAATGLLAEDPDAFGRTIVLQALPGTQGIYGFLIGFIVMLNSGMMGGSVNLSPEIGGYILAAGLTIGVVGLTSGIAQGKAAAAGVNIIAKHPDQLSKAIVISAMVETYAILAFLISMLLVINIPMA